MADVIVSNVSDIKLDVLSEGEISLTLSDVQDINVQFEVAQGPSGPKGDTGDISPELQALADAASVSATQAAASAANASQLVLGQATGLPNVLPTLNLDFANSKILDNRVTFTRASTATYYDGKTVAKAEENLLLRSQEFDNAVWVKSGATVTANAGAAPDGTTTAARFEIASGQTPYQARANTWTTGQAFTVSFFVKSNTGIDQTFRIFLYDNAIRYSADLTATANWQRFSFTVTSAAAATDNSAGISVGSGGTSVDLLVWGAQVEQRSTITAYTPTTTQPITNYVPVLLTAPTNSPRFDHDPVTGESLGLLIEEQRTNLLMYSEQFNDAYWTKLRSDIAANTVIAPDGTLSADTLSATETNINGAGLVKGNITVSGSKQLFSIYIKRGNANFLLVNCFDGVSSAARQWFDIQNGTVGGTNTVGTGWSIASASISSVGNGWYRCVVTVNTSGTRFDLVLHPAANANLAFGTTVGNYAYIWGAQLEAGAFPTSYIKTEASQVTRSRDSATMTGTNFSSWFNPDQGTAYTETRVLAVSSNANTSFGITGASVADRILFGQYFTAYRTVGVGVNNVDQAVLSSPAPSVGVTNKSAGAYKVNDFAGSLNGSTALTDTSGAVPFVSQADIGSLRGTTQPLNGHIERIIYWPKRLSNSELQALTAQ